MILGVCLRVGLGITYLAETDFFFFLSKSTVDKNKN